MVKVIRFPLKNWSEQFIKDMAKAHHEKSDFTFMQIIKDEKKKKIYVIIDIDGIGDVDH